MGLTHYWERPTELPPDAFAAAVRDLARALPALGVQLAGFEGTGAPDFRDDAIVFNGADGAGAEPFEIHQTEFDRRGRSVVASHCKTLGARYDSCVRVALIVLNHHLGADFRVHSDDPLGEAWVAARTFCEETLGYGAEFTLSPV
jgi:hypothetical protein